MRLPGRGSVGLWPTTRGWTILRIHAGSGVYCRAVSSAAVTLSWKSPKDLSLSELVREPDLAVVSGIGYWSPT
jgi:hypothetical protein